VLQEKGVSVKFSIHRPGRAPALRLLYGSLAVGAVAAASACGSTSSSTAASPGTTQPAGTSSPASSSSALTVSAKSVAGVGTVLVNGQGQTLYMLTSEKGGKITCTDDNGCTKILPDTELPKGVTSATAGSGIQSSLLSTVKNSAGELYVTYGGWPLYTFSGDSAPGQAKGEGITSFGGTWYVLGTSGNPVTSSNSQSGSTSSGSGGY
jgi:predicted lipoprotein with Yx(FWY)xxD motif